MSGDTASSPSQWSPSSVDELAEIVRSQDPQQSGGLRIAGGKTSLDFGGPVLPRSIAADRSAEVLQPGMLQTTELNQLLDYPSRDMTVTVQAGMTVAELSRTLTEERQELPLDIPQADQATVGGILACNTSGSRRYGYGTLRDYLIGVQAVDGQGRVFRAGGRVVKNVAGYDLCKLLVGSLGTLAIITEATFKVRPLCALRLIFWVACEQAATAAELVRAVQTSSLRPISLDVLGGAAGQFVTGFCEAGNPEAPWIVLIGFEGTAAEVEWQREQMRTLLEQHATSGIREFPTDQAVSLRNALLEFPLARTAADTVLQIAVRPSRMWTMLRLARDRNLSCLAHAGTGVIQGTIGPDHPHVADLIKELRSAARDLQGDVRVLVAPPSQSASLLPEPRDSVEWTLMQRVKQMFDPQGLLNPGKLFPQSSNTTGKQTTTGSTVAEVSS